MHLMSTNGIIFHQITPELQSIDLTLSLCWEQSYYTFTKKKPLIKPYMNPLYLN